MPTANGLPNMGPQNYVPQQLQPPPQPNQVQPQQQSAAHPYFQPMSAPCLPQNGVYNHGPHSIPNTFQDYGNNTPFNPQFVNQNNKTVKKSKAVQQPMAIPTFAKPPPSTPNAAFGPFEDPYHHMPGAPMPQRPPQAGQ